MGRIMAGNAAGKVVSDIILAVTQAQIVPGDTARFPFAARTAYGTPSVHDFTVISDNPDFNPEWVRIRPAAPDGYGPRYLLEITPGDIGRPQFGAYPLRLSWGAAGTHRYAEGRCTLVIGPAVGVAAGPDVTIWPAGQVRLLLENHSGIVIDVSVSVTDCDSGWSKQWDFGLPVEADPFSFSGRFDPPTVKRSGDFELAVSVAGVPLVRRTVRARRPLISRRLIAA
jgi:hypothetical protein